MDLLSNILISVMIAATPLVLAATGELVAERAGVLNLGVEGMMVVGALAAFAALIKTGSLVVAVLGATCAGATMAALFGLITLSLRANQVAAGLALSMFGLGLSALWGQGYSGLSAPPFPRLEIAPLSDLPWLGKPLFHQDALLYLSLALVAAVAFVMERTRLGLILRAIGENHDAAHAIGHPVIAYRYGATLFGGALAGLGGAYLSLVQTPLWAERMTAGRGWIALALVVFAAWRPWRLLGGAYLFGAVTILQLHTQALGIKIDAQLLSMLPYLVTIVVLVIISRDKMRVKLMAPACLGKPFHAAA
ncbi:MAG TPA: ABC transporter permease [Hyphomicrobiaceae bacterium]|nr:ABC transporter permease [Hyphomicrobiaceae bacterium]